MKIYKSHHFSEPSIEYQNSANIKNGLFHLLHQGYSQHVPVYIRPDDILNTVASIWSKYVTLNAEGFRYMFVEHQGKKELELIIPYFADDKIPLIVSGLKEILSAENKDDKLSTWADAEFSTSEDIDYLVRNCCILASQKEYFKYTARTLCGFTEVHLLGEERDWSLLHASILEMPCFGNPKLDEWKSALSLNLIQMISGGEDYWSKCLNIKGGGSGSDIKYDGWIKVYSPFNEKGKWWGKNAGVKDAEMLDLTIDFEIKIKDDMNNDEFDLTAIVSSGCKFKDEGLRCDYDFNAIKSRKPKPRPPLLPLPSKWPHKINTDK